MHRFTSLEFSVLWHMPVNSRPEEPKFDRSCWCVGGICHHGMDLAIALRAEQRESYEHEVVATAVRFSAIVHD
jgi:hypothetical protein